MSGDVGGLSYEVINTTDVEVTGRASGNTVTSIVIPATVSDGSTTYSVAAIEGGAFFANSLTSVSMPGSVTNIENGAFNSNALTGVIIPDSVTSIGVEGPISGPPLFGRGFTFANNALTSAAFEGNFGTFSLDMFDDNPTLSTITYDEGATGWSGEAFNNGTTVIPATSIRSASTPVPTSPIWLLGIMAGLLSLVAVRKLRKA